MIATTRRDVLKAGVGLAAFAAGLGTVRAGADALKLRYNRWLPATHHVDTDVYAPWFDKVREVTDGRVDIEFTASSLGPLPRQYELVSSGIADLSFGSESLTPGRFPLSEIMEIPFLGDSTYANAVSYWRMYENVFAEKDPYKEVKVLGLSTLPGYHIYTIDKPVRSVEDLKGMKIRATGTSLTDVLNSLGATAVPLNVTELHDALSKGIVDGMLGNDDQVRSFDVAKYFKYKTEIPGGLTALTNFFIINKDKWDRISPEDQAAIEAIAGERHAEDIGRSMDRSVAIGIQALKDAGVEMIVADDAFVAELRERTKFLEDRWIAKASELGVDGRAAIDELRKLVVEVGNG